MLQLIFNRRRATSRTHASVRSPRSLVELREGEHGILAGIDLPGEEGQRLMELGFLPGTIVTAAASAPGGDPRVFRVDGSEVALRSETAARVRLRPARTTAE
ncbi:MAG: ferrous iron transport protein A [Bryobacteraceae bacterium]